MTLTNTKPWLVGLAALLAATGSPALVQSGTPVPGEPVARYEVVVAPKGGWKAMCGEVCGPAWIELGAFPTPADVPRVDVTVSIGFDLRTGRGDFIVARVLEGHQVGAYQAFQPIRMPFAAPGAKPTSFQMTWFKRRLPAAGSPQELSLYIDVRDHRNRHGFGEARGTKFAVVVEMWTPESS